MAPARQDSGAGGLLESACQLIGRIRRDGNHREFHPESETAGRATAVNKTQRDQGHDALEKSALLKERLRCASQQKMDQKQL
jgi:hypothetical protein